MLRILTCGYSHAKTMAGILEGMISGLKVEESYIKKQLERRKNCLGRGIRQEKETDSFEIIAGLTKNNLTDGSPIGILLKNEGLDFYDKNRIIRPSHADLPAAIKYDLPSPSIARERASARETALRVAMYCFTMRLLNEIDIKIESKVLSLGGENLEKTDASALIERIRKKGVSAGGVFELKASGIPIGLGSHSSLDRRLSASIMKELGSLNAVKGVEIGDGFSFDSAKNMSDEFICHNSRFSRKTNHSGGIDAGISTGEPIIVRCAVKPISGLKNKTESFDYAKKTKAFSSSASSDISCVFPAAVIGEHMLSFVLAQAVLEKFGSDSLKELKKRVLDWRKAASEKVKASR